MSKRKVITEKKKLGRPAIGKGRLVGVRLRPEDEGALNSWIGAQPEPRPTVPDAIRRLLRERLGQ